jgi:hypothetical protein
MPHGRSLDFRDRADHEEGILRNMRTSRCAVAFRWAVGGVILAGGVGCTDTGEFSPVADGVERDGWLDATQRVSGDGKTDFVSDTSPSQRPPEREPPQPPRLYAPARVARTQIEGERLYAWSLYRGLLLVDVADPAAPRIEGAYSFTGTLQSLSVEDGRVLLLVNDRPSAACIASGECEAKPFGRVLLLDARAPGTPTLLEEQIVEGTIVSSQRSGDLLYVMSRDLEGCPIGADCIGSSDRGARLTGLSLDGGGAIRVTAQLDFPATVGEYIWGEQRLYSTSWAPVDAAGRTIALQIIDVTSPAGVPRLGARVDLASERANYVRYLHEQDGVLHVVDDTGLRTFAVPSSDALAVLGRLELPNLVMEFDGDRAVAYRYNETALLGIDLTDPAQPVIAGQLELPLAIRQLVWRGDRAFVLSDPDGPDAGARVTLLDTENVATLQVLDALTFGAGEPRLNGLATLFDDAGLLAVPFEQFPSLAYYGAPSDDCLLPSRGLQLVRYADDRLQLGAVAAQPDSESDLAIQAGQLLAVSHLSLQSYPLGDAVPTPPSARVELTRATAGLRVFGDVALRLGLDWSKNALSADLVPRSSLDTRLEPVAAVDVPTLLGLTTTGCSEQRGWGTRGFAKEGTALIPRFHRPVDESGEHAGPFTLTLHAVDVTNAAAIASTGSVELEPLAPGDQFLGVLSTDNALLVARGRRWRDADVGPNTDRGWYPYSAFPLYVGDPTGDEGNSTYLYRTTAVFDTSRAPNTGARVQYDVIDWSDPSAARVTARVEVPELLAVSGWGSILMGTTIDTPWGWSTELAVSGPTVVNRDVIVSQHVEPAPDGRKRFFLDRLDVSDPTAPRWLPPVNIPGAVLHFDSATGELITLEYARFTESTRSAASCSTRGYLGSFTSGNDCSVIRRVLNGLVLEGDRAVRKSQLLLDTDRRTEHFSVSGNEVFYVTEAFGDPADTTEPSSSTAVAVSLERVTLKDGQLERAPSIDLTGRHAALPRHWQHFAARDGRVFTVSNNELGVFDARSDSPDLVIYQLSGWGCPVLEAAGDEAYCAQGPAGVERILLDPRSR